MSVINQMLKDLDARGGGDAQRRAALASTGQGAAPARGLSRSTRAWLFVVGTLALIAAIAWWLMWPFAASRAAASGVTIEAPVDAGVAVAAASPAAAPEPVVQPAAVAPAAVSAPAPLSAPAAPTVAATAPAEARASDRASTTDPADPADASTPVVPTASPPPPRARIEVLDAPVDPLASVRERVAAGEAEAALALLAEAQASDALPLAEADALAAAALQQLGRHGEAIERYARAIQRSPDIGAWWAGLGISLEAQGRAAEALAAYRDAQRRGPLDPALADYLRDRVDALSAGHTPR